MEYHQIKLTVRTTKRVAPVTCHVEANVGISLLKMTPQSYHLYLLDNYIVVLFLYMVGDANSVR